MDGAKDQKSYKRDLVFEPVRPIDKFELRFSLLATFAMVANMVWADSIGSFASLTVWCLIVFGMMFLGFYFHALVYGIRKIQIGKDKVAIHFLSGEKVYSRSSVCFEKPKRAFYKCVYVYINGCRLHSIDSRFDITSIWSCLREEDKERRAHKRSSSPSD